MFNGYDFTARFPKIAAAIESLRAGSCVVDGEAVVVNADGLSVFDLIRYRHHDHPAVLCAFDLIELDGKDLRWARLEDRKTVLSDLLRTAGDGIVFNTHFGGDGANDLPACLGARLRGDCLEAARALTTALAVSITGSRSRIQPRQR